MYGTVRMQEVTIENFKNVKNGIAAFQSYNKHRNKLDFDGTDIMGIYGQNGSGKTTLVEGLDLLKSILSGEKINENMKNLLTYNSETTSFKYVFIIDFSGKKFFIYYNFQLKYNTSSLKVEIIKETLKYAEIRKDSRLNTKTIIDYDIDNDKNQIFTPKNIYKKIIDTDEETNLLVAREFSKRDSTSFIFSDETEKVLQISFNDENLYMDIIKSLKHFAKIDLFVIKNDYLGHINLNTLMPFSFMLSDNKSLKKGTVIVELFKPSTITKETYNVLDNVITQINIVLQSIIPGLTIEIKNLKEELMEDGEIGITVQLLSIRDNVNIPLKFESDGIKKIISILSALIAMYNNEKVCLVVDELDAGIFEFLLGELLDILKSNAKGQLIFTSHNLRPLEVLDKNDVIFTTTNPENRYIRLKNVKNSNNLRDFYLRGIFLGGQDEPIYEKTKSYNIKRAFRKAGNIYKK